MKYKALIAAIQGRLDALGISERKACLNAKINVDSVRRIRNDVPPKIVTLKSLALALNVPPSYLLDLAIEVKDEKESSGLSRVTLSSVYVRGAVQAGLWQEAIEWDAADWYSVMTGKDNRYPGVEKFGLEVRGPSMNQIYPDGTVVVCLKFGDIARPPRSGERVVCLRRSGSGEFEATIKEYEIADCGSHILWPRSKDPEHQQPIKLPGVPSTHLWHDAEGNSEASEFPHDGGEPDVIVSALVITAVVNEPVVE